MVPKGGIFLIHSPTKVYSFASFLVSNLAFCASRPQMAPRVISRFRSFDACGVKTRYILYTSCYCRAFFSDDTFKQNEVHIFCLEWVHITIGIFSLISSFHRCFNVAHFYFAYLFHPTFKLVVFGMSHGPIPSFLMNSSACFQPTWLKFLLVGAWSSKLVRSQRGGIATWCCWGLAVLGFPAWRNATWKQIILTRPDKWRSAQHKIGSQVSLRTQSGPVFQPKRLSY